MTGTPAISFNESMALREGVTDADLLVPKAVSVPRLLSERGHLSKMTPTVWLKDSIIWVVIGF